MPDELKLRLKLLNIYTVEQFVTAPDTVVQQAGPGMAQFQAEARQFLGGKVLQARQEKEAAKEQELADIKAQLASLLAAQNESKTFGKRKKTGEFENETV